MILLKVNEDENYHDILTILMTTMGWTILMTTTGSTKMVMTTMVMTVMIRIRVNWDLPETTQALPLLAGNSSLQEIAIVCNCASRLITGISHTKKINFFKSTIYYFFSGNNVHIFINIYEQVCCFGIKNVLAVDCQVLCLCA